MPGALPRRRYDFLDTPLDRVEALPAVACCCERLQSGCRLYGCGLRAPRASGFGNRAGFPEVAKDIEAKEFNFFGVITIGGFDFFGALVAQQVEANGDDVALVFIAHEKESSFFLSDSFIFVLETGAILLGGKDGFDGSDNFFVIVEGVFFGSGGLDELIEAAGNDGGSATGQGPAAGAGNAFGIMGEAMDLEEGLFLLEPELVAGATPVIEVLAFDGVVMEFVGKDSLDGREAVEPGKNVRGGLAVEETAVKFVPDIAGQAADFSGDIAMRAWRDKLCICEWLIVVHRKKECFE